jgi:hypothetical protein
MDNTRLVELLAVVLLALILAAVGRAVWTLRW